MGNAEPLAQRAKVFLHKPAVKAVMARGQWGVSGEDDFARDARQGLLKTDTFVAHAGMNRLEHGESAMAFVKMQHAWSNAHGAKRAEASDAKQQLLADADAPIASVETRSKLAILGGISFHVRVQEQQVAATHPHSPHSRFNGAAARLNFDGNRFTLGADCGLHGQLGNVGLQVILLLPIISIEPLPEVTLAIEQPDPDEWNTQIGSALDVIAGEYA